MEQIKNRFTGEIMCGGLSLKIVLERHRKWVRNEDGGEKANLSGANLSGAYLRDANLSGANLRDAYLSGANLSGVPKIENIHQKVYAAASQPDALDMSSWHTCETTHCRAGWVIALAGEAGAAMEFCLGTSAAASLIYLKSDPKLEKIPDFHASNKDALEDMKRSAEQEAAAA